MATKKTRLSMRENSRAVGIPREFQLDGDKIDIQPLGNTPVFHPQKLSLDAAHGQSEEVLGRLHGPGSLATCPPQAEAAFRMKLKNRLGQFLSPLEVASFDQNAAPAYGQLRATFEQKGAPIGLMDLLIAAHALSLAVRLVTNNTKEFRRVPGLRLENWA